jgi:hypothetical protein
MPTATIEYTDTFAGEANYSWVERHTFDIDGLTNRQVELRARELVGLTGIRCSREDYGDMVTWIPQPWCTIAFLTYNWDEE